MNWFHFAVGIVLTVLQGSLKNPVSIGKEKLILIEIRDLISSLFPGE